MSKKGGVDVPITGNRCYRCGYEWKPSAKNKNPATCPSCKNPYWHSPIQRKNTSRVAKKRMTKMMREKYAGK